MEGTFQNDFGIALTILVMLEI